MIKKIALGFMPVLLSLFLLTNIVLAPWQTLGTGYAITSNVHGIDVLPGNPVIITAGTLDPSVVQVTFRWHEPPDGNGPVKWEVTKPIYTNGTQGQWNNGTWAEIRYANDTQIPDVLGDWGVQAFFQGVTGTDKAGLDDVVRIRATSFNVVPEIALGTLGAVAAMLIAFGVFAIKKKKAIKPPTL